MKYFDTQRVAVIIMKFNCVVGMANNADPDQIALPGVVWSGTTLFA